MSCNICLKTTWTRTPNTDKTMPKPVLSSESITTGKTASCGLSISLLEEFIKCILLNDYGFMVKCDRKQLAGPPPPC